MLVRLLVDCSLGCRGAEIVVGPADASRLIRKGRALVVEQPPPVAPAPAAPPVEALPEEVPEPGALVTEPPDAEPPAGSEA